jgi:O-antigen/teichoic acid export membrane protein
MKGLFGRDSLYMLLWGVQLGIAALCTPIITRLLGVSQFGLVAATLAVVQVVAALTSFSLQSAVQRVFANGDGDRDARRVVTLAVVLALGMWALVDVTGPLWSQALGLGGYGPTMQYGVAWAALWAITNVALGLIRSHDRLLAFALVTLLQSVVAEVLGLMLVVFAHRTASGYVLGHLVAQSAAVALALIVARPMLFRRRDLPMLAGALGYSVGLVPAALASFVLDTSDRLIVRADLGPAAIARYAVAYNVANLTMVLLYVLNTAWMPRVFALADTRVRTSVLAESRDFLYALLIPMGPCQLPTRRPAVGRGDCGRHRFSLRGNDGRHEGAAVLREHARRRCVNGPRGPRKHRTERVPRAETGDRRREPCNIVQLWPAVRTARDSFATDLAAAATRGCADREDPRGGGDQRRLRFATD